MADGASLMRQAAGPLELPGNTGSKCWRRIVGTHPRQVVAVIGQRWTSGAISAGRIGCTIAHPIQFIRSENELEQRDDHDQTDQEDDTDGTAKKLQH